MKSSSSASSEQTQKAKPFLKWAGGKTQLIDEINARLPHKEIESGQIDTYIEPFVGGGAIFFYLAQKYSHLKHFILFDINEDLINCYNTIKNNVSLIIKELQKLKSRYLDNNDLKRSKMYYDIRTEFNFDRSPAKLIFLNKTCFNGLYRVNRNNEFNVPFGNYKNPNICDAENLIAVSAILQSAEIIPGDFKESEQYINKKCFIYLDPPYRPISKTASFTSYAKDDFTEINQIELANFCGRIKKKGARFLLSNSDPKNENPSDIFFEGHYPKKHGFKIDTVYASRVINCKGTKRGNIRELIITDYSTRR